MKIRWYVKMTGERVLEEYINGEWEPVEERSEFDEQKRQYGRYGRTNEDRRR